MREAHPRISATGSDVVAVATKAAYQARKLAETTPFPLLLDPDDEVRAAIGADSELSSAALLSPKGGLAYARALGRTREFAMEPSEAKRRPGVVLLDTEQNVVWTHVGERLGDYPSIDEVVSRVAQVAGG